MPKKVEKKKRSSEWHRFMYEFFERSAYEQWHDGVNPNVVLDLVGEEREEAENMLIESVQKGGMWPTDGLAALKSKKALPILKKKLNNAPPPTNVRIAEAIEEIEGSGEYVSVIIDELLTGGSPYDRLEAAMVLRKFPTQEAIIALFKGVLDPDYLVRNHSSESLLAIHGFEPEISKHREIFKLICADEERSGGQNLVELYEKAAEMLKKLFKNKKRTKKST
ncbi:MAG: HEAT repeat domain-containing protein [Candidatus Helarchaeota archaeon]|nr:HEAT repeat domain-containing protein [Candidatus Helarchaeota archaeon]